MAAGASERAATAPRKSWRAEVAWAALASAGAVGRRRRLAAGLPETWRELRGWWVQKGTLHASCGRSRTGLGAGWDAVTRAHMRAKRTLWARPVHARDMLDEMPGQPRGFQTTRELAERGYRLVKIHETCWIGQGLKFTM